MLQPSYSELMDKLNEMNNGQNQINSRYSIVIAVAKRARQINNGEEVLIENKDDRKAVSIAVDELYSGKIKIIV
jgi:DNA-directed RNA polymerase, omega subunit